jgi:hypothetical protein
MPNTWRTPIITTAVIFPALLSAQTAPRHNVILFVADGLRATSVTAESAPAMTALKTRGVDFANSHAL